MATTGSCQCKISICPWPYLHQDSKSTNDIGRIEIRECQGKKNPNPDTLTIFFDITFDSLKEWAGRLDFCEWYGARRRPFIPGTCSHCVGYSRGTSMWNEAFGTGLITCEAGSAPVNYSNVWMVHGVGGEERGGERLLSPLLLVCTSLQTLEDGGHTGLWWPVSTFRGHPSVSTVLYMKDNRACLHM